MWVSISACVPACWLVQVGIPGWRWRQQLLAVAVQSDAWGQSHGSFPPPRGIGENFQKWPKTCILVSIGPSPTIVLPLLSYCPEVAQICKCTDNPEQQREGGREAKTFRLSHCSMGTAAESQTKPKQCNPHSCYPAVWPFHCHYSFLPSPERLLKMALEDLREFLQEKIAASLQYEDDAVIEQLQVSMTELRKMKFDLPPPGG